MKLSRLALAACIVWAIPATASAAARSEANRSALLFRQHCKFDASGAIEYCAAESGSGYQFYYCSEKSFGCCHVGAGYCDWSLSLRCSPWRWTW